MNKTVPTATGNQINDESINLVLSSSIGTVTTLCNYFITLKWSREKHMLQAMENKAPKVCITSSDCT